MVDPGAPATGGGGGGPSGGGGNPLTGSWSGNWNNDGDHSLAFSVDGSGRVTGGTLVHPGGITDQVTGGNLSLSGSAVSGQLTFDGFFKSATFTFASTSFAPPGSMSGSLMPSGSISGLMAKGGPVTLIR
jgi:hypothetical protein